MKVNEKLDQFQKGILIVMIEKKLYEEAKIEIIKFDCKDILTASDPAKRDTTEAGVGGNIEFKEMD